MSQIGSLTVDLVAQTATFNANIEKAAANLNSQTARMNRSIDQLNSRLASVQNGARKFADIFLTYEAGKKIGEALDYAASLGEVSQQLGVTTRDLQVYRYIGTQVGVTQEEMEKGLSKLTVSLGQAALGAGAQGKAFEALGIKVRDANGHVKTAGTALPEIADKLKGVEDPAQRAALEIALFGRAGQKLDTILTEGRQGIADYAKQAEAAGMIISDDVAASADAAADKIAAMNEQLKVNFSREVAANADAILGLANALERAAAAGLNFVANYPRLAGALTGAAVGARVGGAPGAAAGGIAGYVIGDNAAQSAADNNMDLRFRTARLRDATARYRRLREAEKTGGGAIFGIRRDNNGTKGATVLGAREELEKQQRLLQKAMSAPPPAPVATPAGVDLPDFLRSGGGGKKGGSGKSAAERAAEEARRNQNEYDDLVARLNGDVLDAKRDNVMSLEDQAKIAREQVQAEADKLKLDLEQAAAKNPIIAAHKEELKAVIDRAAVERKLTIDAQEMQRKADDLLKVQMAANDNQRDMLQIAGAMALTAKERRDVQLRLLDIDEQEERLRLQAVLASRDANEAEKKIAQARLDSLGAIYAGRRNATRRDTMGPLESYADGLRMSPDQINERVQQYTIDELNAVHDGITGAITNAIGVNDPMISGLISLLVDQLLIRPITEALLKAQSAGGGGGIGGLISGIGSALGMGGISAGTVSSLTGSAASTIAANPALFANGTSGAPGGWSIVGETEPELLRLPTGAQVTPLARSKALLSQMQFGARNDNPAWQGEAHFHFPSVTNAREARESGDQAARAFRRRINGPVRSNP